MDVPKTKTHAVKTPSVPRQNLNTGRQNAKKTRQTVFAGPQRIFATFRGVLTGSPRVLAAVRSQSERLQRGLAGFQNGPTSSWRPATTVQHGSARLGGVLAAFGSRLTTAGPRPPRNVLG